MNVFLQANWVKFFTANTPKNNRLFHLQTSALPLRQK